jgi:hypothetical protein
VAAVAWLAVCGAAVAADSGSSKSEALVGTWSGTWSGASTGHIDLTIAKSTSGAFSGSISVAPDQAPAYATTLDEVSVEEAGLTAQFKTPDGVVTITMKGALEGASINGTYEAKENQGGSNVDTGTWTVSASRS